MHMFFAIVAKGGARLDRKERDAILERIRTQVFFCEHVQRIHEVDPSPSVMIVGVSNEPIEGWYTSHPFETFVCGYVSHPEQTARLRPDPELSHTISDLSGRFSALVVNRESGRFALASSAARVDSIFCAENERFYLWGNQASLLSILRDGDIRYAPRRLLTLVNASYFGDEQTPYEGVDVLTPFTTVVVDGARVERRSTSLAELKGSASRPPSLWSRLRRSQPGVDALRDSFRQAFAPLTGQSEVSIGLTGGMDSRVVLAGAVAAGVNVECFTRRTGGEKNAADLWVADVVARRAGVPHRVVDTTAGAGRGTEVDLMYAAKRTLSASDGMLGFIYRTTPVYAYRAMVGMNGHGGEVLRGGFGEHILRPTPRHVVEAFYSQWCHTPELFREDLVEEHASRAHAWMRAFPDEVPGADLFDCLYVDRRCGRWVAGSTRGSTTRITPLLDNRVIRDALRIPAALKRQHRLHRRLIRDLLPSGRDVPLANKFWFGTTSKERMRLEASWPNAYARSERVSRPRARRTLSPDREAFIRRYVFDEDRIASLADLLHVDRVIEYVSRPHQSYRSHDRLLGGLFTACVLLNERWRRRTAK